MQNILYTKINADELSTQSSRMIMLYKQYLLLQVESQSNKVDEVKKLLCINVILIFIAHAVITENSETGQELEQILKK